MNIKDFAQLKIVCLGGGIGTSNFVVAYVPMMTLYDASGLNKYHEKMIFADLVNKAMPIYHDPQKLASELLKAL